MGGGARTQFARWTANNVHLMRGLGVPLTRVLSLATRGEFQLG